MFCVEPPNEGGFIASKKLHLCSQKARCNCGLPRVHVSALFPNHCAMASVLLSENNFAKWDEKHQFW